MALFMFGLGGSLYYGIEILFRGRSHWSMFLLGGLCMVFISYQGRATNWEEPLLIQMLRCAIFITCGEFITGILVNKIFLLSVWDYSDQAYELFGQICLPYMVCFMLLGLMGILLCGYLLHWIYGEKKPAYRVF